MIRGNVFVDFPKWKNKIRSPEKYLFQKIKKLQNIFGFKNKNQEFSILLTNKKVQPHSCTFLMKLNVFLSNQMTLKNANHI